MYMKNLIKIIGVLTLVAIIVATGVSKPEFEVCCGDVDPNPFIEVRSIPNLAETF